jgi:hypothetical protein
MVETASLRGGIKSSGPRISTHYSRNAPPDGMYILWKEKNISKYVSIARDPICVALDAVS